MDRRSFIKLTAITGTSTALASCGNPEHQFIRFVPDEELTPGIAEFRPSVCPLCASGCGVVARVMDTDVEVVRDGQAGIVRMGIAKKLEGNPAHPVSQGRLCSRGQASIQVTYHPDRITRPLKRSGARGSGQYAEISWDDAIKELAAQLDGAAADPKTLAFVSSRRTGQRSALVNQFLAKFGAAPVIVHEIFGDDVLRRANGLSFGHAQLPTYDFGRARIVISFGADFLGNWNSPVAHAAAYGEMRRGRPGIRGAFVQVESRMTQTGANADEWVPAKPGTEGVLALGLAHVILAHKLVPSGGSSRAGALIEGWSGGLTEYEPPKVEEITGVSAHRIERLAHQLAELRPAMAIVGGAALGHTNALFTALAVNALNSLLGNIGEPGGIHFTPQMAAAGKPAESSTAGNLSIDKLASALLAGSQTTKVLLVDGANPVYASPKAWKVREALDKVPFIASFGSFLDETSALADLILPDHSFLESWADAAPESGSLIAVASVAPPAMKPLHQTRAMPDVLLEVAGKLQKPIDLGAKKFDEALKAAFDGLPAAADGTEAWSAAQKQGGWWGELKNAAPAAAPSSAKAVAWTEPKFDGDAQQFPFHFLPYPSLQFLDGSLAHLPWLQEMPDPMTSAMWSSWVELNPKTAEKLGVHEGDLVEIASAQGSIQSAVFVSPAIAPDIVAMPVGQGHQMFTRFASGRGENPLEILAPAAEAETGQFAWAATRVKVTRAGDSDGRLVLFAGETREKPFEEVRRG